MRGSLRKRAKTLQTFTKEALQNPAQAELGRDTRRHFPFPMSLPDFELRFPHWEGSKECAGA